MSLNLNAETLRQLQGTESSENDAEHTNINETKYIIKSALRNY